MQKNIAPMLMVTPAVSSGVSGYANQRKYLVKAMQTRVRDSGGRVEGRNVRVNQ